MGSDIGDQLAVVERAVAGLKALGVPEGGEGLDIAGRLQTVAYALSRLAGDIVAETDDDERGERYEIGYGQGHYERTFNAMAIVGMVAQRHDTVAKALEELVMRKVIRIDKADAWSWRGLQDFVKRNDLTLDVRKGEPVDGDSMDGPHIGEVWKKGTRKLVARQDK